MITSLALTACLELGTSVIPRLAADEELDLPDALGEMGVVEARLPTDGMAGAPISYLRILGSYARYATPDRTRDRPTVPNIPCDPVFAPKKRDGRGMSPAITLQYPLNPAGAISTRPSSLHRLWRRPA